jgi:hypothetical protein
VKNSSQLSVTDRNKVLKLRYIKKFHDSPHNEKKYFSFSVLPNVLILRFRLMYYSNLQFAGSVVSCVTDVNVSGSR